jgi:ATP-binding cassette, subfamily G (WHITE), member 2, PDR
LQECHPISDHLLTTCRNYGILLAFIVFFMTTYLLAAEYITMGGSSAEILIFRRGHQFNPKGTATQDEESKPANPDGKLEVESSDASKNTRTKEETKQSSLEHASVFHWQDLTYDINIKGTPRRILDHVDGWVAPGKLTALMVSS